jgi:hypothetical protein
VQAADNFISGLLLGMLAGAVIFVGAMLITDMRLIRLDELQYYHQLRDGRWPNTKLP